MSWVLRRFRTVAELGDGPVLADASLRRVGDMLGDVAGDQRDGGCKRRRGDLIDGLALAGVP